MTRMADTAVPPRWRPVQERRGRRARPAALLLALLAAAPTPSWSAPPKPTVGIPENEPVTVDGMGGVKIGMTRAEAEAVLGMRFTNVYGSEISPTCNFVRLTHGLEGVWFLLVDGKLARLDVQNSKYATISGAHVGDKEDKLQQLFNGKMQLIPHPDDPESSHTLVVYPDRDRQAIFEAVDGVVTKYRVGKTPEVTSIDGCP